MNLPLPPPGQQAPVRAWPHRVANAVVAVAVAAVAGATFVLSYSGVRAVAITGGVSAHLARVYPGVFDAVLVIACVAAILLRDGRWWARAWAWVVVVVLLAAIGATDVVHAMGYTLSHRPTEGVVAAAPVVAVLLAFSLLLTLLRPSRTNAGGTGGRRAGPREPDVMPAIAAGAVPRLPAPPIALPAPTGAAWPEPVTATREEPVAATREEPAFWAAPEPPTIPDPVEPFPAPEAGPAAYEGGEPTEVISPETPPVAESAQPAPPAIRYASSALDRDGYWESDDDRQFAGQVYPDPRAEAEPATFGAPGHSEQVPTVETEVPVTHGLRFNRVRSTPTPPGPPSDEA